MNKNCICRICGYDNSPDEFWDKNGNPEYLICPCCGCESGHEDINLMSIRNYRINWNNKGAQWKERKLRPKNWDKNSQLKNILDKYK